MAGDYALIKKYVITILLNGRIYYYSLNGDKSFWPYFSCAHHFDTIQSAIDEAKTISIADYKRMLFSSTSKTFELLPRIHVKEIILKSIQSFDLIGSDEHDHQSLF